MENCELTDEEITEYRRKFERIDLDHNGAIDEREAQVLFTDLEADPSISKVLFLLFDKDKSGSFNFEEFVDFMEASSSCGNDPLHLFRLIFRAIDANNNGSLSVDEITKFCSLCGLPVPTGEAKAAMMDLDSDGNGELSFDELCKTLQL